MRVVRPDGGWGKSAKEAVKWDVVRLRLDCRILLNIAKKSKCNLAHRGNRCLGHGTRPNNCGQLRRKLNICGMKNSSRVLEKCP
jgi:hypothetical protein